MGDTTIQRVEKKNPPPASAEHNQSSNKQKQQLTDLDLKGQGTNARSGNAL